MGAIAPGGVTVLSETLILELGIPQRAVTEVVVAVPVAAAQTCEQLRGEADEVVCAHTPEGFRAVGAWYEDFSQTTDDEVRELLNAAIHA